MKRLRNWQIQKEKTMKKKSSSEQFPSTFRMHSRLSCSIAFPEEITTADKEELLEHGLKVIDFFTRTWLNW